MAEKTASTVVICMDGSEFADKAFDWYMENVHHPEDNVILCHCVEVHTLTVMPMAGAAGVEMMTKMMEEQKVAAEQYFKKLTEKMKAAHLHGKVKQCHGSPREEILRVAEEEHATMIVSGTRGMGTVRRTLLGSVSDHLVHHAHIPVLICKQE